jgi:polyhydroxybutyrate depolymerase
MIGLVTIASSLFLAWQMPWQATQPIRLERLKFEHQGIARKTLVYDPKVEGPRPLVIVLHGGMGMSERAVRQTRFNEIARKEGFLVAYPDGTGANPFFFHNWNAGHCCGPAVTRKIDDVGFVAEIIGRLVARGRVDPDRVYVTGFSAGGMLAHKIGVELGDKVAAIAPVAGAMFGDEAAPKAPVSVMMVRYANDNVVPAVGPGPGVRRGFADRDLISVQQAGDYWAAAGGCGPAEPSRLGNVEMVEWKNCNAGVAVRAVTVDGGKHAWPGEKNRDYATSQEIWAFFKDRRRVSPRAGQP